MLAATAGPGPESVWEQLARLSGDRGEVLTVGKGFRLKRKNDKVTEISKPLNIQDIKQFNTCLNLSVEMILHWAFLFYYFVFIFLKFTTWRNSATGGQLDLSFQID